MLFPRVIDLPIVARADDIRVQRKTTEQARRQYADDMAVALSLHALTAILTVLPMLYALVVAPSAVAAADATRAALLTKILRITTVASVIVAALGAWVVSTSDSDHWSQPWVWAAIVVYLAVAAVVSAMVTPNVAAVARGGDGAAAAKVRNGAYLSIALWVVLIALMVIHPGAH
jgi:hypothetical protein